MASQTLTRDILLCPDVFEREVDVSYAATCEQDINRPSREREWFKRSKGRYDLCSSLVSGRTRKTLAFFASAHNANMYTPARP